MAIELEYKKTLAEHNLKEGDVSKRAKVGISSINQILKALTMREKKGKKPTASVLEKLETLDTWVQYEILDQVHGTKKNEEVIPVEAAAVIEEIKVEEKKEETPVVIEPTEVKAVIDPNDAIGVEVEAELAKMHEKGKKEWSIEEIKPIAKKTYDILFDSYEEGGSNGVKTSKHSLLETSPKIFTLN